jgi:hypothetical protein
MKPADSIQKFFKKAAINTNPNTDKIVLDGLLSAHEKSENTNSALTKPNIWSIIMKSNITKLAAAAAIIIALILSINLLDKSTTSAYAIEQTIEANNGIRYLHIKNFTAGKNEPREGWLQFDQNGNVIKVRANMPEWASPVDGPRVIVWKNDKVQMWLKKKNILGTMIDKTAGEQMANIRQNFDPKMIVNHIYELESQGKVSIEIDEPSEKSEPIIMTVTYLSESSTPGRRKVLAIDPTSKLVNTIELYRLNNDQYEYEGVIELLDYNQVIDDKMFDLRNEVPPGTTHFDQTANDVGLAQGQLDDEQIATEVVRQFFDALISEDYSKAGKLFVLNMSADQFKQQFSNVKVLRIVSIGSAVPNPELETKGFNVPCTIEIKENGEKITQTMEGIKVQQFRHQPDRWGIFSMGN